jgi:hypothetical protein
LVEGDVAQDFALEISNGGEDTSVDQVALRARRQIKMHRFYYFLGSAGSFYQTLHLLCGSSKFDAWPLLYLTKLTRGRAMDIINASDAFSNSDGHPSCTLSDIDVQRGVEAAYFQWQHALQDDVLILMDNGGGLFVDFGYNSRTEPVTVTPKQMVRRSAVEVTGITEAPALPAGGATPNTVELVQFKWKWDTEKLPNELKTYFERSNMNSGAAILRLYDDGWRFQSFPPTQSSKSFS